MDGVADEKLRHQQPDHNQSGFPVDALSGNPNNRPVILRGVIALFQIGVIVRSSMSSSTEAPIIIIGAGPAGLTAGVELARLGLPVHVIESDPEYVGGIARTVHFGPYRLDIGGHRFFTRNTEVMQWWQAMLPEDFRVVERQSRIYFNGRFFDYPLRAPDVLRKLGLRDALAVPATWLRRRVQPVRPETSFRDWVVNRFGDRLFECFFESYTEKVWGLRCSEISADWAAQRIQGLSLQRAILNSLGLGRLRRGGSPKTLIERFHYPRLGCGQMWEQAREAIEAAGGVVELDRCVVSIRTEAGRVEHVTCRDRSGNRHDYPASAIVSSMPLRDLVRALEPAPPEEIRQAAESLGYRDFITVALVVERPDCFSDQWIYIHEPSVRVGRVQNFRNWSPDMVPDPAVSVLGLEYFCFAGDSLWNTADEDLIALATQELETIGLVEPGEVREGKVVRMEKAYPVYDHDYKQSVATVRDWLKEVKMLWSAGRNAMHQYNNQDHSMAAALLAAKNLAGKDERDPWSINHEGEFTPRATPKPIESALRR